MKMLINGSIGNGMKNLNGVLAILQFFGAALAVAWKVDWLFWWCALWCIVSAVICLSIKED